MNDSVGQWFLNVSGQIPPFITSEKHNSFNNTADVKMCDKNEKINATVKLYC